MLCSLHTCVVGRTNLTGACHHLLDFFPTYKKFEEREPADYSHRGWVHKVYRVNYKEHFYKGGGVRDRIPGWCDRIQFHSLRDLTGQLTVDMRPARVDGVESQVSSYRSMNDIMTISDHSPVSCGFTLHQQPPIRQVRRWCKRDVPAGPYSCGVRPCAGDGQCRRCACACHAARV